MPSLLQLLTVCAFFGSVGPCAPTDPGTTPATPGSPGAPPTTTTTLPPCCRTDIYIQSPRSLFDPVLTACPTEVTFICSVSEGDLSMETTMIVINEKEVIAMGPGGMNSFAKITCNAQKKWQTESGAIIDKIACK